MLAKCCRLTCVGLLALLSGCAMCANCGDRAYPADGGRWQRLDPCHGRVGSVFTPEVGSLVGAESVEAIAPGEPTPADNDMPAEPPRTLRGMPETSVLQSHEVITR
jgi:hypothetical protein